MFCCSVRTSASSADNTPDHSALLAQHLPVVSQLYLKGLLLVCNLVLLVLDCCPWVSRNATTTPLLYLLRLGVLVAVCWCGTLAPALGATAIAANTAAAVVTTATAINATTPTTAITAATAVTADTTVSVVITVSAITAATSITAIIAAKAITAVSAASSANAITTVIAVAA